MPISTAFVDIHIRLVSDRVQQQQQQSPALDAPVSQMVDQLSGFLKHDVVQVIDVAKILVDSTPLRRPLSEPQMVEQLVEMPVPEAWCIRRTTYTRRERPFGFTASPGRFTNTGQG